MLDNLILAIANRLLRKKNRALTKIYRERFGRPPDIAQPQRYSERMLWRKVLDHSPQFIIFSDKLATKEFTRNRCPGLAIPRTLWVGQKSDAIPDELLRGDVYVKTNHGCDFNQRIRDGICDRAALRRQTEQWLGSIYGAESGQWGYAQVEPKLFVEEAIGDATKDLIEFQVRAANGKIVFGSVMGHAKTAKQWLVYLDALGAPIIGIGDPDGTPPKPLPTGISVTEPYLRAVEFTERLSVGVDYARFDFMWNGQELYGGEITVYPAAGLADPANRFTNDLILNGWDLLEAHFLKSPQTGWRRIYANALKRKLRNENKKNTRPA